MKLEAIDLNLLVALGHLLEHRSVSLAARETGAAAVTFAGAIMAGVWAEERNIADRDTLLAIAGECDLDGDKLMAAAETQEMGQLRAS